MAFWLSKPIESLLEAIAVDRREEHCDVLVVGSGYGGSIAAMRLAGPGRKVLLFERGKEYALGDFPENIGDLPGHVRFMRPEDVRPLGYADALFDLRVSSDVAALVGNGLGGGSLINANVAIEPDEATLGDPVWPAALRADQETLRKAMGEVRSLLGVTSDPETPGKVRALRRVTDALGASCEAAPISVTFNGGRNAVGVEQEPCVRCGNCITGCNVGAKNTLAMNALPLAQARGALIYTGATVHSLEPVRDPGGADGWIVNFRRTATLKGPPQLRGELYRVYARKVILAAGTLGSTEILLRTRERNPGGPGFSGELGKRFSTNGDTIAFGYGQRSRVGAVATSGSLDPGVKEVGPTISAMSRIKLRDASTGEVRDLLLEDGAVPASLARVFAELAVAGSLIKRYVKEEKAAWFDGRPGKDPLGVHPEALQHSQALLGMGDDGAKGSLSLKSWPASGEAGAPDETLKITWKEEENSQAAKFLDAVDVALGSVEAQGFDGGDYLQNPAWSPLPKKFADELTGGTPRGPLLTVHPLGGCPMGDAAASGAVNDIGQVYRRDGALYAGLYVMDGAVIPRALGVNPFLTIGALAWRASGKVLEEMRGQESALKQVGLSRPPCSRGGQATRPEPVSATFEERLIGDLGEAVPAWARARTGPSFAPRHWLVANIRIELPDLESWLAEPAQALRADCRLYVNSQDTDVIEQGHLEHLATAAGYVRLLTPDGPRDETQLWRRAFAAINAYSQRAGASSRSKQRSGGWLGGLFRVARNHAHWRALEYDFRFQPPGESRFWVLKGRKSLAFHPAKPNVWRALIELPIDLAPEGAGRDDRERYRGTLKVDLVDLSRRALIQVRDAVHSPAALMGLIGAGALFARVLFQTHFWSFGAPDYPEERASGKREPEAIRTEKSGRVAPEHSVLQVAAGLPGEEKLALDLWRYPAGREPRGESILLLHGLAHGANVFTTRTIRRPLAAWLHDEGYEVWLLDYRLSPALAKPSERQSTMDEIAQNDIADAVAHVYKAAGKPIHVFAHCIGAGCFSMSVLGGHCQVDRGKPGPSKIKSAAIHAVPPWVVASKANRLRGNLAAFVKDVIGDILVDPIPPNRRGAGFREAIIDRFAGSLPWARSEAAAHASASDGDGMGQAICNRMTLFYGVEWVHENLSPATHRGLAGLVGVGNIETFRQIFFLVERQRLTDRDGTNRYLTLDNIWKYWSFPTLFAHGRENQVFSPVSSRRSAVRLEMVQKEKRGKRGPPVYLEQVDGYGHMDFLFGSRADRDVYPKLGDFFSGENERQRALGKPSPQDDPHPTPPRAPLTGPVIGLAQADPLAPTLRIWVEAHDDVTSAPNRVRFSAHFANGGWRELKERGEVTRVHDARRSDFARDWYVWYFVYDVKVPRDAIELRTWVYYEDPEVFLKAQANARPDTGHLDDAPLEVWRQGGLVRLDAPWFRRLGGRESRQGCVFLAGSCRYPGSPFEREASDAIFSAMAKEVARGADHVLLVGDQIYADATADVFDTQELGERYAGRYRAAYKSKFASRLLAGAPVYMALDDHEFCDNWDGRDSPQKALARPPRDPDEIFEVALETAKNYQWAMSSRSDEREGLWYRFASAGLPFFVMDTRSQRQLRTARVAPQQAAMVSDAQLRSLERWLEQQVALDPLAPKFIVCGSPIGPVRRDQIDQPALWRNCDWWFGYPKTLAALARMMTRLQPRNVVFVSGDYHFSAIADLAFYCDGKLCAQAKQIVASGLYAPMPFANERPGDFSLGESVAIPVPGSDVVVGVTARLLARDRSHFLRVEALPRAGGWELSAAAIGADGNAFAKETLL